MHVTGDPDATAETVARESYGKLLSILSSRTSNIAAAEDALAGAFEKALGSWQKSGTPDNPEAWLLTVAKRSLIDEARHQKVQQESVPALIEVMEDLTHKSAEAAFPDERLTLLFVCTHPALDQNLHTPLMLQTVLGLEAGAIAKAFLVKPATMSQRLVRAKQKIRDAGIPFSSPPEDQLTERVDAVLNAIYVAFTKGADDAGDGADQTDDLSLEAIWLGYLLVKLMPEHAEAKGLLALMLYHQSRKLARTTTNGDYVPLSEQDVSQWDAQLIHRAEGLLSVAAIAQQPGRFQIEAAIQSAHIQAGLSGSDNWPAIISLYTNLIGVAPSVGARVSRASAMAQAGFATEALQHLDALHQLAETYQPYWATRAYVLKALGTTEDAVQAYDQAITLSDDPAVRRYLIKQRNQ
jgi:RNA polymerase sigma-70 factor (ECF subfamily)